MVAEKLLGTASVCAVIAAIVAISDEAHQFVGNVFEGGSLWDLGSGPLSAGNFAMTTVAYYTADHLLLVMFGVGSVVFLGLMLKT